MTDRATKSEYVVLGAYRAPGGSAVAKEIGALDHHCVAFLALCPFVVMSTATPTGQPDISPRGGEPGFLRVLDAHTLLLIDSTGNNRLDSLRKVAANPQVALLCMIPGVDDTLRIHGRARLLPAEAAPIELDGRARPPRSVLRISVEVAFLHCAKALMRSRLWDPASQVARERLPSTAAILRDHTGATGPLESQDDMRRRYEADL